MKRIITMLLATMLVLSLAATMFACDQGTENPEVTTETPTDVPTEAPSETEPEETTPEETTPEETTEDKSSQPVEGAINIGTAEELIAWANTILEDGLDYMDVTINFTADIDLAGYNWIPVDGAFLDCVVFEGNGHTISNMTIEGTDEPYMDASHGYPYGFGFIQNAEYDLTFRNLTFDNTHITAWERHVGVLIGNVYGNAWLSFENVHVTNTTVDGWMEYKNADEDPSEHSISFRVAGFVGGVFAGTLEFVDCTVKEAKLSGFHNLAGFVGYDATGALSADSFTNCHVENIEMTFSYCMSNSYTADQPRKFVSVFYNSSDWVDNIDDFDETGNTFKGIYFIDYTDPDAVYDPNNFRSWTYEEAHPN